MRKSNEISFYIQHTFFNLALFFVNGTIVQSFLLEIGMASDHVSIFVSMSQMVQLVVMLAISKKTDNSKNIIKSYAFPQLAALLTIGLCLVFCLTGNIPANFKFYSIITAAIITNIGLGIFNVVSYKMPYHILDMHRYGVITGISGVITGICGIIFSSIFSFFLKSYPFTPVMTISFILAIFFVFTSFFISLGYTNNKYEKSKNSTKAKKINLFTYKPFLVLFVPNLLRGFNSGFFIIMVTLGYELDILDSVTSGYLLIIGNVAMLLSCFVYSLLARRHIDNYIIFFSSIAVAALMPLFGIVKNPFVFLALYGIGYFIYNFINYAVPVLITQIVDYDIIGQYTSWRMMLHTLGISAAGFLAVLMLKNLGPVPTLIIAGFSQLVSGIVYFICHKSSVASFGK